MSDLDELRALLPHLRARVAVNARGEGTAFADPLSQKAADAIETLLTLIEDRTKEADDHAAAAPRWRKEATEAQALIEEARELLSASEAMAAMTRRALSADSEKWPDDAEHDRALVNLETSIRNVHSALGGEK
jgi:hypothetical protein